MWCKLSLQWWKEVRRREFEEKRAIREKLEFCPVITHLYLVLEVFVWFLFRDNTHIYYLMDIHNPKIWLHVINLYHGAIEIHIHTHIVYMIIYGIWYSLVDWTDNIQWIAKKVRYLKDHEVVIPVGWLGWLSIRHSICKCGFASQHFSHSFFKLFSYCFVCI